MGEVAITYKVMPDDIDVDLEALKNTIKSSVPGNTKLQEFEEQAIAFGLKALIVKIVVPDAEGGPDAIEDMLLNTEGVQSVEAIELGRLL